MAELEPTVSYRSPEILNERYVSSPSRHIPQTPAQRPIPPPPVPRRTWWRPGFPSVWICTFLDESLQDGAKDAGFVWIHCVVSQWSYRGFVWRHLWRELLWHLDSFNQLQNVQGIVEYHRQQNTSMMLPDS